MLLTNSYTYARLNFSNSLVVGATADSRRAYRAKPALARGTAGVPRVFAAAS